MSLFALSLRLPFSATFDAAGRMLTKLVAKVIPIKHAFACDPYACTCYHCGIDTFSTCCYQLICC